MQTRLAPLLLALTLVATGCARSSGSSESAPSGATHAAPAPPKDEAVAHDDKAVGGLTQDQAPKKAARSLIVTEEVAVVTEHPDVLADRLRTDVVRAGGFVAEATSSGANETRSHRLVLRVPANQTRTVRTTLSDYGKITSDTEKTEDVTEQHADVEARLANARTQEKRLLEIMQQKTGSVAEVLEVERELARVRETIERYDAQKRALDGKIELATVTVSIGTPRTYVPPPEEGAVAQIKQAFHGGIKATGTLLLWAAMALAATSPVLVPLLLAGTGLFVWLRRRRRAARVLRA